MPKICLVSSVCQKVPWLCELDNYVHDNTIRNHSYTVYMYCNNMQLVLTCVHTNIRI